MRTASSHAKEGGSTGRAGLAAAALLIIVALMHTPAQFNSALPEQGQSAPLVLLFMASLGPAKTLAP